MLFHSTRGNDSGRTFDEVLMQGLANDGGLFMPDIWPQVDLKHLKTLNSFLDIAKYIVPLFTKSSFSDDEVLNILDETWHDFGKENLAEIHKLDDSKYVLELFHGPTAAFKDFGLQLAAAFFNQSLKKQNKTAKNAISLAHSNKFCIGIVKKIKSKNFNKKLFKSFKKW